MTNYYISDESYQEKLEEDKKVIEELNDGKLTFEEGEKKLDEIWNPKHRKKD